MVGLALLTGNSRKPWNRLSWEQHVSQGWDPWGRQKAQGGPGIAEPFGVGLKVGFGWGSISAIVQ